MCTLSVSNVIYHKFSHGAAFYTLNGKNVNAMLELFMQMFRGLLMGNNYLQSCDDYLKYYFDFNHFIPFRYERFNFDIITLRLCI